MFKQLSDEGELPQDRIRTLHTLPLAKLSSELVSGSVSGLESQRPTLNGGSPKPQTQTQERHISFDRPLDLRRRNHCISRYLNRLEETIPRFV
jgi:hypothetical protein